MELSIDREKVVKGLELCLTGDASACKDCPYDTECEEAIEIGPSPLQRDALALLKEHEPVKPKYKLLPGSTTIHEWDCGNCGYGLFMILSHENRYSAKHAVRYCAGCGRPVKWE